MEDALRATAVRAVEAAGTRAVETFRATGRPHLAGDYTKTDVKTVLDRACEERAIEIIRGAFPKDGIRSEEAGHVGPEDPEREWVLDPLDGTNNVAAGLPIFASAVAVRNEDVTDLAAVHEPLPAETYVAERGGGVTIDGRRVEAGSELPLSRGTVSFVVGLPAVEDSELKAEAGTYKDGLGAACKRVLSTWAPCVDWGLLARGAIEAVVAFRPDEWEVYAGELLARESGATIRRTDQLDIYAASDDLAAEIRDTLPTS